MKKTVVFDFDGVIHSYISKYVSDSIIPDVPVSGIKEAIDKLREHGYRVDVLSSRSNTLEGREAMKSWMHKYNIVVDEIVAHKVPAVAYIDDRAICFRGNADKLLEEIESFTPWYKKSNFKLFSADSTESRKGKHSYYLDIASCVASRSTCIRRKYGAVIVKNDEIVSTGYNGAPRGRKNCSDMQYCYRAKLNVPHGERYELCRSVHAEANAIISASRTECLGSTLYLAGIDANSGKYLDDTQPCSMCKRLIINSGITTVVEKIGNSSYNIVSVSDWVTKDDSILNE